MNSRTTLYLHIGQHKTGTSTVQSFFWRNRERIARQGVLYPELGMAGPTHANFALGIPGQRDAMLAAMFARGAADRTDNYQPYRGQDANTLFALLGERIRATKCRAVLLSSECFMEWIEPADLKALIDRHCQCDVKVLIFLRRQDQWIQAVFNQVVKDPGLRYGGRLEQLPQMEMLDYQRTVQGWAAAFGQSSLVIWPYQRAARHDMGVLGMLAREIGLGDLSNYDMPSFQERNVSLEGWQLKILHALNRRDVGRDTFQAVLDVFSRRNETESHGLVTANTIGFDQAKALYGRYRRGNRWIARTFLNERSLFGKPKPGEYTAPGKIKADAVAELLGSISERTGFDR